MSYPEDCWSPAHLDTYVRRFGDQNSTLLPKVDYPNIHITPGRNWHNMMNAIRDQTAADGLERFGMIGVRRTGELYLPKQFEKGSEKIVSYNTMLEGYARAAQRGANRYAGDIHSHFIDINNAHKSWRMMGILGKKLFEWSQEYMQFVYESPADIHGLLTHQPTLLRVIVARNINCMFFRSRETPVIDTSLTEFRKQTESMPGMLLDYMQFDFNLVVYKGKKDEPLRREFPSSVR